MLHHTLLTSPSAQGALPEKWMLFLHGLLGQGSNWRSFARRFVATCPAWGAALVDLRLHGGSQGLPPPHTLAAAAADLDEMLLPGPIHGVVGHSFGGKVALRWLGGSPLGEARPALPGEGGGALAQSPLKDLTVAWIIDSTPSARRGGRGPDSVVAVFGVLRRLPPVHRSRDAFVAALQGEGVSLALAQWLAMNLERTEEGGMRFRLDLDGIGELLEDYFRTDLWPVLCPPPAAIRVHLVAGGRSEIVTAEDRVRATTCGDRVLLHVLAQAGHFVHVDDPDGLLRLLTLAMA